MELKFLPRKVRIIFGIVILLSALGFVAYYFYFYKDSNPNKYDTFDQLLVDKCSSEEENIECWPSVLDPDKLEYYSTTLEDGKAYVYKEGQLQVSQFEKFEITGYIDKEVDIYPAISGEEDEEKDGISVYVGFNQKWGVNYFGTPVGDLPLYFIAVRKVRLDSGDVVVISYKQDLIAPGDERISDLVGNYATVATEDNWEDFYWCPDVSDDVLDKQCEETKQSYIDNQVLHVDDSVEAQHALASEIIQNPEFLTSAERQKVKEAVVDVLEVDL